MDVAGLRDRIQATLDSNADIRRQAELDLKYVGASLHRLPRTLPTNSCLGGRQNWLHRRIIGYSRS